MQLVITCTVKQFAQLTVAVYWAFASSLSADRPRLVDRPRPRLAVCNQNTA